MRLIDADALMRRMYHDAFETDTDMQRWDSGCWIRYKMFENAIGDAPTIDAVPLEQYRSMERTCYTLQKALYEMADRKTEPMKTTDYCKKCNHKGCETCAADGSNPYCVPSRFESKDEPQTERSE